MDNEFPILQSNYYVKFSDGAVFAIPVAEIATSRADAYKGQYGDDFMRSMYEDTLPLFQEDSKEIEEWARNNMNWSDVCSVAVQVTPPQSHKKYPNDWVNPDNTEVR
jgi:hypothetical protein